MLQTKERMEIEEKMLMIFQLKELVKDTQGTIKMLMEEVEVFGNEMEEDLVVAPLPDGTFAVLTRKSVTKEKLDKDALANRTLIAKDEMKTPFDFSKLTELGKINSRMITECTETRHETRVRLSKRKTPPRVHQGGAEA